MEHNTLSCPRCGRAIYRHVSVCPYCHAETKFVTVDELRAQQSAEAAEQGVEAVEVVPSQPTSVEDTRGARGSSESRKSRDSRDSRESREPAAQPNRVSSLWKNSRFSKSTLLIGAVIGVLALIVLGIFLAVIVQRNTVYNVESNIDGWTKQVLDSMDQEVSLRGTTIAKFPDKTRHYMLYLQDRYLHLFDAQQHTDEIFDVQGANPRAVVDYTGSGILNAYLSPNEKYVIIIASRAPGNSECGLYRMETDTKIVQYLDRGRVTLNKEGYQVQSYGRSALYDANGDHLTGISGDEAERAMQTKAAKPKKEEVSEEEVEVKTPAPSVTQQIQPHVDIVPKPQVPEEIKIKPVEE